MNLEPSTKYRIRVQLSRPGAGGEGAEGPEETMETDCPGEITNTCSRNTTQLLDFRACFGAKESTSLCLTETNCGPEICIQICDEINSFIGLNKDRHCKQKYSDLLLADQES